LVAFRADGGRESGLGHVRRCLALAAALSPSAHAVFFLHGSDIAAALVRRAGIDCRPVGASATELARALEGLDADALVVDAYSLDPAAMAAGAYRPLIVVDDSGRFPVPGDVVVNSALGLQAPDGTATRYLLGPAFALLAPAFAQPPVRSWNAAVRRVLLTLGGATAAPATASLAAAVRAAVPGALVDVVVGPVGDSAAAVESALGDAAGVVVQRAPADLRPLMLAADLAVSAGGVTLLELAATATPTVAVAAAANQQANLLGLARLDAIRRAGGLDEAAAVGAAVAALAAEPAQRRALGERARQVVDGGGAARVAAAVRAALATHPVGGAAAC
jgi:spore coat polysaccharide biosynthesis predicted glycosyltransferase SpsG